MKNLFLVLAALATTGAAADPRGTAHNAREAVAQQPDRDAAVLAPAAAAEETVTLRRRECEIACPLDRQYCYFAPYSYKCDRHGKLQWSRRDLNCEQPTSGCWCGCDWRAPGIERRGVSGSGEGA